MWSVNYTILEEPSIVESARGERGKVRHRKCKGFDNMEEAMAWVDEVIMNPYYNITSIVRDQEAKPCREKKWMTTTEGSMSYRRRR